ncbi:MAG TPA: chromate resistance protein ChrB domain-containing protein [Burkholderiaceae bacterium]|nr:chromate resistance protein ChrB domain-containing protein [Burkholderiaceae bacterium]
MTYVLLLITLPTRPNAVRLRMWRGLKALGAAALRDGAYLLPAEKAAQFDALAVAAVAHGGSARVLAAAPRDAAQGEALAALFDRRAAYAEWRDEAAALRREAPRLAETEARRRLRAIADALDALLVIDFFPGPAAGQAREAMEALRADVEQRFAAGEPRTRRSRALPRLQVQAFQGKRWATRARPWIDRLASAWLIRRFIDGQARFVWLADVKRLPRGAIGFDFDGARFTHIGPRVTFEVLAASFGLDADPALQRLGALVRFVDAGGIPVAEAAGVQQVLGGLRALHADDDRLLDAACAVFDALYTQSDRA